MFLEMNKGRAELALIKWSRQVLQDLQLPYREGIRQLTAVRRLLAQIGEKLDHLFTAGGDTPTLGFQHGGNRRSDLDVRATPPVCLRALQGEPQIMRGSIRHLGPQCKTRSA